MSDFAGLSWKVLELLNRGVRIWHPPSVDIGDEVNTDRIAGKGVEIFAGARIYGSETLICKGAKLGEEGPVVIRDCRLGENVELKGGYFRNSVFLDGAVFGSAAQVREGCLIEEQAGGNHAVGLKQTILFPFVTLGSLVNFCDCLMAGGTSRRDHSEVGSSFIHFNYTPHQDKATASLIGDVTRGVMLNCAPIFLGGQGGIAGPSRIDYGTVLAAGSVLRGDVTQSPQGGRLVGGPIVPLDREFHCGMYTEVRKKAVNNILYIASLLALREWYKHARSPFLADRELGPGLLEGANAVIESAISERIKRFREFADKMEQSISLSREYLPGMEWDRLRGQQKELLENRVALEVCFSGNFETCGTEDRDRFIKALTGRRAAGADYISAVQKLDNDARRHGTAWLQAIVDAILHKALDILPSFK
jgi:UDP-N-acetylglucosamine/UDP-N-acetylgalactosamine diphosphorylase